jgi:hypothetical protein
MNRRELLRLAAAGGAAYLAGPQILAFGAQTQGDILILNEISADGSSSYRALADIYGYA